MGAALSCIALPALGSVGGWIVSCFSAAACSLFCKSCNCNNSIATRIGYAIIFLFNSILAWLMLSNWMIKQLQHLTLDYLKLECAEGTCYGIMGVHRVCFALVLFHTILGILLLGVRDSRQKRASIQNGWWGPKVLAWLGLLAASFFIPNGFFLVWGNYFALIGAALFILFGLVLLVDFAHSWTERCIENYEVHESNLWKYILIGGTLLMFAGAIALTGIMYGFFATNGCSLNQFFVTFNLILCFIVTIACIYPTVQDANPRSVANEPNDKQCNPLRRSAGTQSTSVVLGAIFTFLAIAYSTSRAATQDSALMNSGRESHDNYEPLVTSGGQANTAYSPRNQLVEAVERGALPRSALDENMDDDDADDKDDERYGSLYNYSFFHFVFAIAAMYIAMLLTNWNTISTDTTAVPGDNDGDLIRIGQSYTAVWVKIVSGWLCHVFYGWSLIAPVIFPDRFADYY